MSEYTLRDELSDLLLGALEAPCKDARRRYVEGFLTVLLERRVADALNRRYVHHNPQARVTGDPGQFCKRCETAHPTLEVCPEVDMRPAAEPTAAPEQPKVGAELVHCLRGAAALGLTAKLQPEDCAALLRAIGEQP
jgi:hypothetical protein